MNQRLSPAREEQLAQFLGAVLEDRQPAVETGGELADLSFGVGQFSAAGLTPIFWADAPWRLEPDQGEIPFTFIVRDAQTDQMRVDLSEIVIYETAEKEIGSKWADKKWQLVHSFSQGLGRISDRFWTYRPDADDRLGLPPTISLTQFKTAEPGRPLLLKVIFRGRRRVGGEDLEPFEVWQPLVVSWAAESLPLRASGQWYYGDTHYHSSYTNDLKEFGNPIPDSRAAAQAMGLDWLIITDHSVDLADNNPYWADQGGGTRWDDLGREADIYSDERFQLVRGEEVTLLGDPSKQDDTLHMLVFGANFTTMIPGAFAKQSLLAGVATRLTKFTREAYEHLFGPLYKLGEVLTGSDQAGRPVEALRGRSVQAQGALAFAAHPTALAQLPGSTWEDEDLQHPIHGLEAWNIRMQRVTGNEENPFEHWQAATSWEEGHNKLGIDLWAKMLQRKVGLDMPRFVLLAGTDAHGSFNYSLSWWLDWNGVRADDNSLGKVRTLLYLPYREAGKPRRAPSEAEIIEAIRLGSCVATDGPVLNLSLAYNDQLASLGQVMSIRGDGEVVVNIQAASTAEFGPIEQVEVIYFFQDDGQEQSEKIDFQIGQSQVLAQALPSVPGYVRLAVETTSGDEVFRCFTNPIWLQSAQPGQRRLVVRCIDW